MFVYCGRYRVMKIALAVLPRILDCKVIADRSNQPDLTVLLSW